MVSDIVAAETSWQPILEGSLAEDARAAVLDVARAIANHEGASSGTRPSDLTLFWAYVAGAFDDDWVSNSYDEATGALCAHVERGLAGISLYGGLAGAGWVLAHVSEEGAADEVLVEIDSIILKALEVDRWTSHYDLVGGLVGHAVYLLERVTSADAPIAREALDRVVDHLAATAEATADGVTWHTAPQLLPPQQREACPEGYFNCGLAHGVPGVVAVLGRIATLPDAAPSVKTLCGEAMRWLHGRQLPPDPRGRYPGWLKRGETGTPTRTAWCYGDPGIAIAMWSASLRTELPTEPAIALARECIARAPELCGVLDTGLCHGASGLAHIFNRWFQVSGDPVFRDAACTWFRRTLDLRRPEGVAGFPALAPKTGGAELEWIASPDILVGATGVALAMLAALEPVEPKWDRLLQCDMP